MTAAASASAGLSRPFGEADDGIGGMDIGNIFQGKANPVLMRGFPAPDLGAGS